MSIKQMQEIGIPLKQVGPIRIRGVLDDELHVPLATLETPLWPSVDRGARVSRLCGGVRTVYVDGRMSRSVVVEAPDAQAAGSILASLRGSRRAEAARAVAEGSRFARLLDIHGEVVGRLLFVRLEMSTGEAAGHNMVTAAADRVLQWMLSAYPELRYVSISGNFCTDKKCSAVNGILGRGHRVIAEAVIPAEICREHLRTTPEKMVEINTDKNLIGSILAGSVRSANAHFANMLLAFYLATGQDAANIVEGSQGITCAAMEEGNLYFSVTVPNIIAGTVGAGKNLEFARRNLEQLGCLQGPRDGAGSRRLAAIAAAVVWCGELSLLAAQTNRGELMRAHIALERQGGGSVGARPK